MPAADTRHQTARAGAAVVERLERRALCAAGAAPAGFSLLSANVSLYQTVVRGDLQPAGDVDYFALGRLRAGDVLAVALSGLGSARGTLSDPLVTLYAATGDTLRPVVVSRDDDGGSGQDALVLRHEVPADAAYFVKAASGSSSLAGSYEASLWLETNTGGASAGAASAALSAETEPNADPQTADDLSTAWRPVRYVASWAGAVEPAPEGPADHRMELRSGDVVSVFIDSTSALDAAVELLDESGVRVMAADAGDSDRRAADPKDASALAVYVPKDGVYRVRVRANDRTSGGYRADVFLSRQEASVVGRHVFYNNSHFDGHGSDAGPADDGAIAADKTALRPGRAATIANVTNYSRGINGVMVDVAGLRADLAVADVRVEMTTPAMDRWVAAPPPSAVTSRRGAGVGGSDRLTLTWRDGSIVNRWLRVTIKASQANGLAADDVFMFGHLAGESGDDPTTAAVTGADVVRTRLAVGAAAGVTNPVDFNRDGRVNGADQAIVRAQFSRILPMPFTSTAAASAPASGGPLAVRPRGPATRRTSLEAASNLLQ